MSTRLACLAVAIAAALPACATDDDGNEFIVSNRSSFVLQEVHLAPVDSPSWGPNLLPDVLFPGEDLIIADLACGSYDALVVDEDGIECQLLGNDLCFEDTDRWVIDDFTLNVCAFLPREQKTTDARPADATTKTAAE